MYKIEYYSDKNGDSEISEFFAELAEKAKTSKDARINLNKIAAYMNALKEHGTRIGKPEVEYLGEDIWELRPLAHRIFFFYWKDNKFVLLHHYIKKSQKTPPKELAKAKSNMIDWKERKE